MAQRLSPQGYIYGEEPYSEHPFWEQQIIDANIEPITITPTDQQQVIEATALIDGYAPITVEPAPSSEPVIEPLSVTLTNQQQVITAPAGVDGYSPVTIPAAPTPTEPVIRPLSVTPSSQQQTFTPPSGVDGYAPVVVGAAPTPTQPVIQPLSITPSSQQQVITAPSGVDGYSPITVAAAGGANLQSIQVSPELTELYFEPEPGYTGFSDVTVDAAIPFSMSNNQLKQCYYGTSATVPGNATPLCFNGSDYKNAAETVAGEYVITYFISVVVSSANYSTLESNILSFWQDAIDFQTREGGTVSIVAYTRASAQGSYVLHTIV